MEDKDVVEAHKKAGMVLDYKDSKDLGRLIDEQLAFCKDVVSKLYEKKITVQALHETGEITHFPLSVTAFH